MRSCATGALRPRRPPSPGAAFHFAAGSPEFPVKWLPPPPPPPPKSRRCCPKPISIQSFAAAVQWTIQGHVQASPCLRDYTFSCDVPTWVFFSVSTIFLRVFACEQGRKLCHCSPPSPICTCLFISEKPNPIGQENGILHRLAEPTFEHL